MLCKCHWIVLYTVHFTAFPLGGAVFFPGHGVVLSVLALRDITIAPYSAIFPKGSTLYLDEEEEVRYSI